MDQPLIIKVASVPSARMQVYFIDNEDKVNALPPDYAYPECFPHYTYDRKIIHLAKDNSELQT